MALRIPFGMDRMPRGLSPDDPRLPGVMVGDAPLLFNSEPLPPETMAQATSDHAARLAAMRTWLHALCGDYAPLRVLFVDLYLAALAAHIDAHHDEVSQALRRYDGLYVPQDWLWSAPRPLPRALLRGGAGMVAVDFAFWDGARAIAIDLGGKPQTTDAGTYRIELAMLPDRPLELLDILPDTFRWFWRTEILPRSPFRRMMPKAVPDETA